MGLKLPEKAKKNRGGDLGQASREKVMAESEGNQISLLLNRYFSKNKKETRAQIRKLGQQRLTFFRTKGHNRGNKT